MKVSDHAIARYYERVAGIKRKDIERMVVGNVADLVPHYGDGIYRHNSHYVAIRKGIAVTVYNENQIMSKERKKERKEYLKKELEILEKRHRKREKKELKRFKKIADKWGGAKMLEEGYVASHREKEDKIRELLK